MEKTNLILCGFMGCGKTTVGRALAETLGLAFVDMDAYIEETAGLTIPAIFAAHGEAHFRRLEEDAAGVLSTRDHCVIATGGGALLNSRVAAAFRQSGLILWLDVPFDRCWERIKDSGRPLVKRLGRTGLEALYRERAPFYRAVADLAAAGDTTAHLVTHIIEWIKTKSNG